jgi:polyhydroxybutyrate depolymerase
MQIHGTMDPTVPYGGNAQYGAIEDVVDYWVNQTGSNTTPQFTAVPDINTGDGCTAEHYVYSGGQNNSSVEFFKIIDGGHTWPGAPVTIGTTNQDFSASVEIWRFFSQYRLDDLLNLEVNKTDNLITVYPNPSSGKIKVQSNTSWDELTLIDVTGRIVQSFDTYVENMSIEHLETGIYSLQFRMGQNLVNKKLVVQK